MGVGIMAWLGLDSSKFDQGMGKAGKSTDAFARRFSGLAKTIGSALSVGAVIGASKKLFEITDNIGDAAESIGVTTDEYQALANVMRDMGVESEQVNSALTKLAAIDLRNMSKGLRESLESAGISVDEFAMSSPDKKLETLAKAFADTDRAASGFSATVEALGSKMGPRMANAMLEIGQNGLPAVVDSMKKQGRILSSDFITMIGDLDAKMASTAQKAEAIAGNKVLAAAGIKTPSHNINEDILALRKITEMSRPMIVVSKKDTSAIGAAKGDSGLGLMGGFDAPSSFEAFGAQIGKARGMTGQLNSLDRLAQLSARIKDVNEAMEKHLADIAQATAGNPSDSAFSDNGGV